MPLDTTKKERSPAVTWGDHYQPGVTHLPSPYTPWISPQEYLQNQARKYMLLLLMYSASTFRWHGPFPGSVRRWKGNTARSPSKGRCSNDDSKLQTILYHRIRKIFIQPRTQQVKQNTGNEIWSVNTLGQYVTCGIWNFVCSKGKEWHWLDQMLWLHVNLEQYWRGGWN